MRVVFANPHAHIHLGKMVSKRLIGHKSQPKYFYLLRYWIKANPSSVAFFIDGTRSSFNEMGMRVRIFPKFFSYIELLAWMLINRINPFKHKIFFSIKQLNPQKDVIFNFSFTTIDSFARNNDKMVFHTYDGLVITHLTHYFKDPGRISGYLKKIKNSFIVAENDLAGNEYFHHYFPEIKSIYHLPFTFDSRFKRDTEFIKRKNKCFGIGTFSTPKAKEFMDFFGEGTNLQPMRKAIYQKKKELELFIDCYMYDFDPTRSISMIKQGDSSKMRLAKRCLPGFMLCKILPSYQSSYLSFDIVKKYNEYRMFVCPEEIVGLPSVSVFEGMACGCVFFGIDDPMYSNLGMKDSVNYVVYKKDSIEDLINKIRYYQEHEEELKQISQKGMEFLDNLQPTKIAKQFWSDIENLLGSFCNGNPHFFCSFRQG